jgi:hypothetical protein
VQLYALEDSYNIHRQLLQGLLLLALQMLQQSFSLLAAHPHVIVKPACTLEQHHALLNQKVAERAIQLLVAQQVVKGLLALRAPLLAQRPLQDAVDCRIRDKRKPADSIQVCYVSKRKMLRNYCLVVNNGS